MTKRERCLRYIIKRLEIMPMFALVDCGFHEQGVDELEVELQNMVFQRLLARGF